MRSPPLARALGYYVPGKAPAARRVRWSACIDVAPPPVVASAVRSQRRRSACGKVVGGGGRPVPTAEEAARSEGIWAGADADAATTVVSACWSAHRDPPSRPKAAYRSVSRPRREHPRAATKGLKHPNRGRRWPPYILGREDQPKTGSSGRSYGHRAAFPPTMPRLLLKVALGDFSRSKKRAPPFSDI